MIAYQALFLVITYVIAAIPFGFLLTKKFSKKDIRELGSKNIGATNVSRIAGKKLGLLTLILDGLKGAIMVIIARFSFYDAGNLHLFLVLVAATAVIAHIYPIYLNFKGGKGVATAIAVLLTLDFSVGFLAICFWIMSFCLFRISSIASLIAIFSSIILSSAYDSPTSQLIFCGLLFILIFIRHKENIIRLITGEEKKL
ncbi:MAG: acyl-phosphate glycerol 3-phosphate acyltransferase [Alphaproteobacteria bacterium RIFCSPLOWO2_01_FULL_40_26]|nr:MAG: acyl-phosphate glycerol 3-phosphate acyltransferase [Alphaproteobacteria bacterium RIFCSPHIGHO2_02_FULL_40_34]OFW88577.1 MAG: acyl-phosphate glycerol 3-phosphate acyltransferase [Alphaproteobacteria bacterium RIFCSPHIGHO2_01_FULL_40_8]OFW94008.1 MAG: acyl-phosphate glycerol 3-phosphate acyltransferase [Alphaproteobacteria bacterium RIFCSPLOWO2_01_FULL_40_26]OFX09543.1 MAG: acyl-phosphate glycerol 3-phosphate acyltransferase [Alphaproteobacteria bacterium RIFCSPLOWO2_02_FULL_40_19]OFX109